MAWGVQGGRGMNYTVNGKAFGRFFGDANRYAINLIREGACRSAVVCGDETIVAYLPGPNGLAMVVQ